ncbi:Sodium ion-translocating decarboxylase [methanotrophic bacterial endosymbiont of Bathymodiolus sp.]|jgi:oxaloacetate decarboxylase gamma subunit|nr:Sodium ion-translocating decarboxylase [methanotrophic bacterial endosymbiont of Bathymodiolus sp.]
MNEAMTQGVELMLTGMGIVFLFLVMLIAVVKLIAYCVATFIPEVKVATVSDTSSTVVSSNAISPNVTAAITAAVHQHRSKHK